MREVVNLISSDPPLPERPRPQNVPAKSRQAGVGRTANSRLISSDSIDISVFNSDDFLDKPAKKRRVSNEKRSPLQQSTVPQGPSRPLPSVFSFSDDDFALPPSNPRAQKYWERDTEESDPIFTSSAPEPSKKQRSAWSHPNHKQSEVITLEDDDDNTWKSMGNLSTSRGKQDEIQEFSDPFGFAEFEDTFELSEPAVSASKSAFSSKTASLLSGLNTAPKGNGPKASTKSGSRSQKGKGTTMAATAFRDFSDEVDEPAGLNRTAKKPGSLQQKRRRPEHRPASTPKRNGISNGSLRRIGNRN